MTSQSAPDPWDFTEALNLLHALQQPRTLQLTDYVPAYTLSPSSSSSSSLNGSPKRRATLGNFDRVFRKLNRPIAIEALDKQGGSFGDDSSVSDDETTPPTTPLDCDTQQFDKVINTKEVKWTDEVDEVEDGVGKNSRKRMRSIHSLVVRHTFSSKLPTRLIAPDELSAGEDIQKKAENAKHQPHRRSKSQKSAVEAVSGASTFESEVDDKGADWWLKKSHYEKSKGDAKITTSLAPIPALPSTKHLLPAWVTPLKAQGKLWQSPVCIDSGTISPMLSLTKQEKKARLIRRLGENFGVSFLQYFDLPRSLLQYGGNDAGDGIHVFVDSSNIVIGFYDALKLARGLPIKAYTKRAPLSFHSLALIMERGRGVAKRVLVGSSGRGGEVPDYMQEAARCGYEVSSLDRVEKFKETRSSGKKSRSGNGYGTSGQSSGSEAPMAGAKKVTEQGVDEILHMKMLESIVDSKQPSTIVLATGDAAEAEYSGGFLRNVERALNKGWKVELVAWGHSMSYAYQSAPFLEKWKDQFMIIDLDDFSEELLGVYIEPNYMFNSKGPEPSSITISVPTWKRFRVDGITL
jgi:hypothetical protein